MIRQGSRHTFAEGRVDEDSGRTYLTDRVPYRFRALADNVHHVVQEGETYFSIAGRHFAPLDRAAGYWWAICDFQPHPVNDPTVRPSAGSILVLPSVRTLTEQILGEARREEPVT